MDKGSILAVDDTVASLKLLTDILGTEGYKVLPFLNGELALTAAALHPPDLVLLDVNMPGMNGFEVGRRLKARPETQATPIIFVSAFSETVDKVKLRTWRDGLYHQAIPARRWCKGLIVLLLEDMRTPVLVEGNNTSIIQDKCALRYLLSSGLLLNAERQFDTLPQATTDPVGQFEIPEVALDDFFRDCQSQPRAGKSRLARVIDTEERVAGALKQRLGNTGATVLNADHRAGGINADLHNGSPAMGRRIDDHVAQRALQGQRAGTHGYDSSMLQAYIEMHLLKFIDDLTHDLVETDGVLRRGLGFLADEADCAVSDVIEFV
jgi:CheY-like chemotaxis protein